MFKPTDSPAFVTVAGVLGNNPSPFVLNPDAWIIKIKIEKSVFLVRLISLKCSSSKVNRNNNASFYIGLFCADTIRIL